MPTAYIVAADLTAYGVDATTGEPLIAQAQRVIDRYVVFPVNLDGSKFPRLFGDYYGRATLAAAVTDSGVSLSLADTVTNDLAQYPAGPCYLRVEDELMLSTSRSGSTITVDERGHFGTDAAAHEAGVSVRWAVVPQGVRDAVCEQVAWLLAEGTRHQLQGGNDSLIATTMGATKQRAKASSAPLLAPMAKLALQPFMQRIGWA